MHIISFQLIFFKLKESSKFQTYTCNDEGSRGCAFHTLNQPIYISTHLKWLKKIVQDIDDPLGRVCLEINFEL